MAGQKVGGRATQPSQKQIEEMLKEFDRSRPLFGTHLGRYQFQRNDICYANNVAPSRADIPVWTNTQVTGSQGREFVMPDIRDAIGSFQTTKGFEQIKNSLKFKDIIDDIATILGMTLDLKGKKVQQAQTLAKIVKEMEQLTHTVKSVTEFQYRGSVMRLLGSMDGIIIEIKHFYERVDFILIDFNIKTATQMAAAEKELNTLMTGFTKIQVKIADMFNSINGWIGKSPKIKKLISGFIKFNSVISRVMPILSVITSYLEFLDSVNKFGANPTDQNKEKMNIKLINFCVEGIVGIVIILVACFCPPLALILAIIHFLIGIRDLVTGEDTIAELILSSWNKRVQILNDIQETINAAKNRIKVFADDVEMLFWETANKVLAIGG